MTHLGNPSTIINTPILTDHTAAIRTQIHAEVDRLCRELQTHEAFGLKSLDSVEIGYLAASHRGAAVFDATSRINDMPVRISYHDPYLVKVNGTTHTGAARHAKTRW